MKSFFEFRLAEPDKRHLTILAGLRARPGHQDALLKLLRGVVEPTRQEKGCLCYILHQSQKDPELFTIYQAWEDESFLKTHAKMPYVQSFGAAVPNLLEGPILHTHWRILD